MTCTRLHETSHRIENDWRNAISNAALAGTRIPMLSGFVRPTIDAWESHNYYRLDSTSELADCTHFCNPSGLTEWWAIYTFSWLRAWTRGCDRRGIRTGSQPSDLCSEVPGTTRADIRRLGVRISCSAALAQFDEDLRWASNLQAARSSTFGHSHVKHSHA